MSLTAKKAELKKEIAELQEQYNAADTPQNIKDLLKGPLENAKKQLKDLEDLENKEDSSKPPAPAVVKKEEQQTAKLVTAAKDVVKKAMAAKKKKLHTKGGKKSLMALVRANKKLKAVYAGKSEKELKADASHKAKPAGSRTSASGKEYREYRANRVDVQTDNDMPYLEKGGEANTPLSSKQKIRAFIKQFPVNAVSWSRATGELPDLHKDIASLYNETAPSGKKYEFPAGRSSTPAIHNTKHGNGIKKLLTLITDAQADQIVKDKKEWFIKYAEGGSIVSEDLTEIKRFTEAFLEKSRFAKQFGKDAIRKEALSENEIIDYGDWSYGQTYFPIYLNTKPEPESYSSLDGKPERINIFLQTEINKGGVGDGKKPDIARTYTISFEVTGRRKRARGGSVLKKFYGYARSIDKVIEEFNDWYFQGIGKGFDAFAAEIKQTKFAEGGKINNTEANLRAGVQEFLNELDSIGIDFDGEDEEEIANARLELDEILGEKSIDADRVKQVISVLKAASFSDDADQDAVDRLNSEIAKLEKVLAGGKAIVHDRRSAYVKGEFEKGGRVNKDIYLKDEGDFVTAIFLSDAAKECARDYFPDITEESPKADIGFDKVQWLKDCAAEHDLTVDDTEISYAKGGKLQIDPNHEAVPNFPIIIDPGTEAEIRTTLDEFMDANEHALPDDEMDAVKSLQPGGETYISVHAGWAKIIRPVETAESGNLDNIILEADEQTYTKREFIDKFSDDLTEEDINDINNLKPDEALTLESLGYLKVEASKSGKSSFAEGGHLGDDPVWHQVGLNRPPKNFTPAAAAEFKRAITELQKEKADDAYYKNASAAMASLVAIVSELLSFTDNEQTPGKMKPAEEVHYLLQKVGIYNYKTGLLVNTDFLNKELAERKLAKGGNVDDEDDFDETETMEPDYENDSFITDNPREGYDVNFAGKYITTANSMEEALKLIKEEQKKSPNYFPTLWFVSDHGNAWPIDNEGNEIKYKSGGQIKSFADLKRKLQKGQGLKMVNYFGLTEPDPKKPGSSRLGVTRYVVKVQTNGVYLNPDKNASTGSYLEFPPASLVEISDKGFKVYGIGERPLNEKEKEVIANRPRDEKQEYVDAMSDGNTMYYRTKNYYEKSGYGYLFSSEWQKGLRFNSSKNVVMDKSIRGPLEMEYEFVDDAYSKGGRLKSALMRDRKYQSREPWEQAYRRTGNPKHPHYAYAQGGIIKGATVTINSEKLQQHFKATDTTAGKKLYLQLLKQANNTGKVVNETFGLVDIDFGKAGVLERVPKSILQPLSFSHGGVTPDAKFVESAQWPGLFTIGEDNGEKPLFTREEVDLLKDGYKIEHEYRAARMNKETAEEHLQSVKRKHPEAVLTHSENEFGGNWRIWRKARYAQGGEIKNQYAGKTAEQVWGEWNHDQRQHFLLDHGFLKGKANEIFIISAFSSLPDKIQSTLDNHVHFGQYAKGGTVTKDNIEKLAKAFSKHLWVDFKDEPKGKDMAEIIRRNKTPEYQGGCATHDFCDSNMVMDAAFTEVMGRDYIFFDDDKPETENQNSQDTGLINAAWSLAKKNDFYQKDKSISGATSYAAGGRTARGRSRDRKFKSQEPHEQKYTRKTSPKNPVYKKIMKKLAKRKK